MTNTYPVEKITELNSYMVNFVHDIVTMEDTLEQLNKLSTRGIFVDTAIGPLTNQIREWKLEMDSLIEEFINNILNLKELDDRIETDTNTDIVNLEGSYEIKWQYLYTIYNKLFDNLRSDIDILNNVNVDINKYEQLGVKLGESQNLINDQVNNITHGITDSLNELDNIIEKVKNQSKKILTEDELLNI